MRSLGKGILFGCGAMLALAVVVIGGIVLIAGGMSGGEQEVATGPGATSENPVPVGEPTQIGDVVWSATNPEMTSQISDEFETLEGNFVVVDITFTNNSNEAVLLDSGSLAVVDEQGRVNEASTDASTLIDSELNLFLNEVNPGVTEGARVAFEVAPDAQGWVLRANDAGTFSENYTFIALGL